MTEQAIYRTMSPTFVEPHLLAEGVTFAIDPEWEPGNHLEPVNDVAKERMKRYHEEKPHAAGLLPPDPATVVKYTAQAVGDPALKPEGEPLQLAAAQAGAAQPGPTEAGGKIAEAKK